MDERAVTDRVARGTGPTTAAPSTSRPGGRRRAGRVASPWALWTGGFVVAGVLLFWLYLRLSETAGVNSDAAGQVLQGWELMHGNLLLRGWVLSDVSFYTFEVPLDGLVALVRGVGPDAVHVSAALIYTLLVLVAALLAKGKARGREGAVRALLTAGALSAPGLLPGTHVLLLAPDHTGIAVPVLLTLLLIDLAPQRWWVAVAACVLLTLGQIDDPLATYALAIPLAVVCLVRAVAVVAPSLSGRHQAAGQAPDASGASVASRALPWYDAALAVAAVASYGLARVTLSAIRSAGGFYVHPVVGGTGFAPVSAVPRQLLWTVQNVMYLFGANYFSQTNPTQAAIGYLHLAGVALALCGLAIGVWGLFFRLGAVFRPGPSGRADRVTQTITLGAAVTLAAGALGTHMALVQGAHEIAVVLPLCAVLGGRLLGTWLSGVRLASGRDNADVVEDPAVAAVRDAGGRGRPRTARGTARVAVASVLAIAGVGYIAALSYDSSQRNYPAQTQDLADWLLAHHLTSGIAGYWEANVTTLATGDRVHIAPLFAGGSRADAWETKRQWYDPSVSYANFIVTVSTPASAASYARVPVILARYGKPSRTYHFNTYTIMVYDHNLLPKVLPLAVR